MRYESVFDETRGSRKAQCVAVAETSVAPVALVAPVAPVAPWFLKDQLQPKGRGFVDACVNAFLVDFFLLNCFDDFSVALSWRRTEAPGVF